MTRIIRGPGPRLPRRAAPDRTRVLHAAQLQALREAEEVLAAARAQARSLLAEAAVERAALERASLEQSNFQAALLLARAEERAARIVEEARQELTTLAVRMAEKILAQELRLHPEAVCSIAEQCLATWPDARNLRLRVSPEDLPLLQAALPRLGRAGARLQLQADASIGRGGCLLQTELGEVDGRLEVQLARLAEALNPDGHGEDA